MKKLICGMLAVLLVLAGTACEKQSEQEAPFPVDTTTRALLDSGAFSEPLEELELDIALMMFWLDGDAAEYEGSKVYYSTGATSEIVAVIQVADEGKVPEVEQALKAWVDSQIEAESDYRPTEVPKLMNATLVTRGNSVLLAVAADRERVEAFLSEQ